MTPEEIIRAVLERQPIVTPPTDATIDILSALSAAGYVIVPREPTPEMVVAADHAPGSVALDHISIEIDFCAIYRAMIAASQGGNDA
jgi:hypothetical protein